VTTSWAERRAPNPGDLIYHVDPDGNIDVDHAWAVLEVEGPVPAEKLAPEMPWQTYWSVRLLCDGQCATTNCPGVPDDNNWHLLSAADFVSVTRLPEFQVQQR
jgi:hypothetical protein